MVLFVVQYEHNWDFGGYAANIVVSNTHPWACSLKATICSLVTPFKRGDMILDDEQRLRPQKLCDDELMMLLSVNGGDC